MRIQDAPMHTLLVIRERMGEELRETFYVRREGLLNNENFVAAYGIAIIQGYPWRRSTL